MDNRFRCRAKRMSDGKWIEGCPFTFDSDMGNQDEICMGSPTVRITYQVSRETMGRFTGICDMTGRKIFEGDIIRHYNYKGKPERFSTYTVVWDEAECGFRGSESGEGKYLLRNGNKYEIVGNVYDNPEILR